jgi:hypothetical protein
MSKLLYSQSTKQTCGYPRLDDEPIVDLDPDLLVLTIVDIDPPGTEENQTLSFTYIVDVPNLEYRQQWVVIDLPAVSDWDGFNLTFSTLPSLLQAEIRANQNHPSIVSKKDLAYSMISSHGVGVFSLVFPLFCQAGAVDDTTRIEWATLAATFNMPKDFIDIIRGN